MKKSFVAIALLISVCALLVSCGGKDSGVNFYVDDTLYANIKSKGNEEIRLPDDPFKDGYVFHGWYKDKGTWKQPFDKNSLLNQTLKDTLSVYAYFTIEEEQERTVHVSFDTAGGGTVAPVKLKVGDLVSEPQGLNRPGYDLAGWYKEADYRSRWDFAVDRVFSDMTLYAKWVASSDMNDAQIIDGDFEIEGNNLYIRVANACDQLTFSEHLTLSPYAVYSIYRDSACTDKISSDTVEIKIGNNLFFIAVTSSNGANNNIYTANVYRKNIFTVTFRFHNGRADKEIRVEEDSLIAAQDPGTKTGYSFAGWADWEFDSDTVSTNVTLEAQWKANEYDITFDSLLGSPVGRVKVTYGTSFSWQTPVKTGYDFLGWSDGQTMLTDASGHSLAAWNKAESLTATAVWKAKTYTIEYTNLKGAENPNAIVYTIEDTVTFTPTAQTGYTFIEWRDEKDNVVTGIIPGSTGNRVVKAVWEPIVYTATFVDEGIPIAQIPFIIETESLTEPEISAKPGYTAKWETYSLIAGDITVNAVYTPIKYDLIYHVSGPYDIDLPLNDNPTGYTIESATFTLTNPSKAGYIFEGWYKDETLCITADITIETGSIGNQNFYAKWNAITYSIIYNNIDGLQNPNPATYTIENDIILKSVSRPGYTFGGFFNDKDFATPVAGIKPGNVGDIALYAKFTANTYTVWLDGKFEAVYTVSFNLNGADGNIASQLITADTALSYPAVPERSGYIFGGWFTSPDCSGKAYDFMDTVQYDTVLYAKWIERSNPVIEIGSNATVSIMGTTLHHFDFVPLLSGEVHVTTTGTVDTFGYLYNENGALLKSNDDGAGDANFSIKYYVSAGQKYTIACRGFGRLSTGESLLILEGNNMVAVGGTTSISGITREITFGTSFTLPLPNSRKGYRFLGWSDENGVLYTDKLGNSIRNFDKHEETVFVSSWEPDTFSITFVTNGGSPIDTVALPAGNLLDINGYVTTRSGYTFLGWYLSVSDSEPYNAPEMPDHDITLYAKWTAYAIDPIKYDESITTISALREITADDFGASCFDNSGNPVEITLSLSTQVAGETAIARLTAMSNGRTRTATIRNIKIYAAPTLVFDESVAYFNLKDGLTADWFGASGTDTYGESTEIAVEIEGDYAAGDIVTVIVKSLDPAGNVTSGTIANVKVYGLPAIEFNEEKVGISINDTLSAELLSATATDSFGEAVTVSVTLSNGTIQAGKIVTLTLTAVDQYGNITLIDKDFAVYGVPSISQAVTTDFSLEDNINAKTMGLTAYDTFGSPLKISLNLESGLQAAGETMVYLAKATDIAGNLAVRSYYVKIYGTPIITYDTVISTVVDASLSNFRATDSFGHNLPVAIELLSGTFAGGNSVIYSLSATDRLGNCATVTTSEINVYDPQEIIFLYEAFSTNNIKISSHGEEFSATATDSFGDPCDISIERADGKAISVGEIQTVVIVATDPAGNRRVSEAITDIGVYDTPVIKYSRMYEYILDTELSTYDFLFTAVDSFGEELYVSLTVLDETDQSITIKAVAEDNACNIEETIYELKIVKPEQSCLVLVLQNDNDLWEIGLETVTVGEAFRLPHILAGTENFSGWDLDGIKITDDQGNSIAPWQGEGGQSYVVTADADVITYNITYHLDGGINDSSNRSNYSIFTFCGTDGYISLAEPVKSGNTLALTTNLDGTFNVTHETYSFTGWYTSATFSSASKITAIDIDTGNINLYARWSRTITTVCKQIYTRNDNIIYFGTYPQSKVTDADIIDKLGNFDSETWISYKYYVSGKTSDFMYYIDKVYDGKMYRGVYFTSYRPSDCNKSSSASNAAQDENGYYINTVYWFKYEPIKWTVVAEGADQATLLADLALDSQPFDYDNGTFHNNYAESTIRIWLNEIFYNTAFNTWQRIIIKETEIDNSLSTTGNSSDRYICENTKDNVFIMSYAEATSWFNSDPARQYIGSDYAKVQGSYVHFYSGIGYNSYWLRSPSLSGYSDWGAKYVNPSGDIQYSDANFNSVSVLPALIITL